MSVCVSLSPFSLCLSPLSLPSLSPFSLPSSSSSFFLCLSVCMSVCLYVCLSSFSLCVSLVSPFSLSLLSLPSLSLPSSSSFFYVCLSVCLFLFFYLIFYFWTDLGTICHSNKSMEQFLTIPSSINLQTNSKKKKKILFFLFSYFLPHFFIFDPFSDHPSFSQLQGTIFNHPIIHIFTNELKKTNFFIFFIFLFFTPFFFNFRTIFGPSVLLTYPWINFGPYPPTYIYKRSQKTIIQTIFTDDAQGRHPATFDARRRHPRVRYVVCESKCAICRVRFVVCDLSRAICRVFLYLYIYIYIYINKYIYIYIYIYVIWNGNKLYSTENGVNLKCAWMRGPA